MKQGIPFIQQKSDTLRKNTFHAQNSTIRRVFSSLLPFLPILIISCLFVFSFPAQTHAQSNTPQIPGVIYNNQVIVQYKDGKTPSDVQEQPSGSIVEGTVTKEKYVQTINTIITQYKVSAIQVTETNDNTYIYTFETADNVDEVVGQYKTLPIENAQPNYQYYLYDEPNDSLYNSQWAYQRIASEAGWDITKGSEEVKVGIVDTGIDVNHPDLNGNVVRSVPIAQGCFNNGDSHGHGTHIAGIVGALTDNSRGVAGTNWDVSIYGYCAVGTQGVGSSLSISEAINRAIDDNVDVINLSLGSPIIPGIDQSIENALARAEQNNIVVVAAAGNCGRIPAGQYPNNPRCYWGNNADNYTPGASDNTISVAATGPRNERAAYSNIGSTVDIAAPGGNPPRGSSSCDPNGRDCILSTWNRSTRCISGTSGDYCSITGTSMSAPFVTGLVALIRSVNPDATAAEIRSYIADNAQDLGRTGRDPQFGDGLINIAATVRAATSQGGGTTPSISPTQEQSPTRPVGCQNAAKGDIDCNGKFDLRDFEEWRRRFVAGRSGLNPFEQWRRGFSQSGR